MTTDVLEQQIVPVQIPFSKQELIDIADAATERGTTAINLIRQAVLDDLVH